MYTNLKHILLIILFFSVGITLSYSQETKLKDTSSVKQKDVTVVKKLDSLKKNSTELNIAATDSTQVDSLKKPKEFLADIIKRKLPIIFLMTL